MREVPPRDPREPPHERLAIGEQSRERGAQPGPREDRDATAIAIRMPAHRLACTMGEHARSESAARQRARRGLLDPALRQRGLGEEPDRQVADPSRRREWR